MQIIGRNSLSLLLMYQSEISQQKLCNRKENYSDNHVALRTAFAKYLPIKGSWHSCDLVTHFISLLAEYGCKYTSHRCTFIPGTAYASFLFSKGLTECNINPHQLAHLYLNRLSNQGRRRRVNRSLACLLVTDCLWKI
ncbi:uncharacterized protein LOC121259309 isoform X1 [Juglans microcarpa x Juglans regia]|uniref:uncharacterized protein LOC121259309 isoform X1 n=1 Tax=Juglans microcarpa x Juglans regia TaxID=2249226 RepID=UPI001B7F57F1|nr:uncharacterized protein LOC121259309 isoform X1 [Juglans microcarpa x Juglans regia]